MAVQTRKRPKNKKPSAAHPSANGSVKAPAKGHVPVEMPPVYRNLELVAARLSAWASQRDDIKALRFAEKGGRIRCAILSRSDRYSIEQNEAVSGVDLELARDPKTCKIDLRCRIFLLQLEPAIDLWFNDWK